MNFLVTAFALISFSNQRTYVTQKMDKGPGPGVFYAEENKRDVRK